MVKTTFQRYAESGRVVVLNYGPHSNKTAVIVDIIDHNRALIEGPTTGVPRQVFPLRRMILTKLVLKNLPKNAGSGYLKKLVTEQEIDAKWSTTSWAQKLARRVTRAELSDFQRFQVGYLKKQRKAALAPALESVKAE
ncbi:hypothetical protein IWQ60_000983 [Tieghemiomyces parasiticus]|uniref:60S ribosomal protein L14 n=1 Tax=Tieghemiomyces parasiticus TaxID=78921 RepID=A0A9W8A0S4_9FUNG|nr:hypothetical protein IWQ60_006956 [Tieghemiomyces parasiticus]KAJ1929659.1 hypothetical protein IWQ60_000983 [Tieghemiomyces parasiticus]